MVDLFQSLGAIAGVASVIFVLWERWFRFYPSAFFVARPLVLGGADKSPFLRVENRSERPLILTWDDGPSRTHFRVGIDQSTRAIVRSLIGEQTSVAIDGTEAKEFPVYKPDGFDDLDLDAVVELRFSWRFAQPMLYKRDRQVALRIDKRSILVLTDSEDGDIL